MLIPHAIDVRSEFARVRLGDRRLNTRLDLLVSALQDAPDRSFPSATRSDAELEGTYRFLQNGRVTLDRLIEPHIQATIERAGLTRRVLVVHDTTEFRFEGMKQREGLGKVPGNGQGFFGHFALVVSEDDREALGLAGIVTFARESRTYNREQLTEAERAARPSEFVRWGMLVEEVHQRMGHLVPIHVMDREADDFAMLHNMYCGGLRFVVRMNAVRRRKGKTRDDDAVLPIERLAESAPLIASREVSFTARPGKRGSRSERTYPTRDARVATLKIFATVIEVQPPRWHRASAAAIPLSIVRVVEVGAPNGESPVEWMLMSTEPIENSEQVLRIVDAYRARWMIEEYFKALKTGCAIERRQLESLHSLLAALGVLAPIAVRLLALRTYARRAPDEPATAVLTPLELQALRAIARSPVPSSPTVRDALFAVAALGGHLKRNGDPGWITLARGFEKLDIAAQVLASISDDAARCDQS
jgi:hypothetical protein